MTVVSFILISGFTRKTFAAIAGTVSGITIAGNLRDMLRNIAGVANDVLYRSSHHIGSIWLEKMTVAGEAS